MIAGNAELGDGLFVDLAQVVIEAFHLQPFTVGGDHAPGRQVVQGGAPQHGFFAAGVHGDVAADAGGVLRSGVHGKHVTIALGNFADALGHHARAAADGGDFLLQARQLTQFDEINVIEFFGVDHRAAIGKRHGRAGVTGTAAARDDGQAQFDTGLYRECHFLFRVGANDYEGVFHAPVGSIGNVGDAGETVEVDVVLARDFGQAAQGAFTQFNLLREPAFEIPDRRACGFHQGQGIGVFVGARRDLVEAVMQGVYQRTVPLSVFQQVILDKGIAEHHPHITQHLEQHARGTPGLAGTAQAVEGIPHLVTEKPNDDFTVGKGGVIVGNLAKTLCVVGVHSVVGWPVSAGVRQLGDVHRPILA